MASEQIYRMFFTEDEMRKAFRPLSEVRARRKKKRKTEKTSGY